MKLTVTINGKPYEIDYTKKGVRYTIASDNEDLRPHLSNTFHIWDTDEKITFTAITDKTEEIATQLIDQIRLSESRQS